MNHALALLIVAVSCAFAQPAEQQMLGSSVIIFGMVKENGKIVPVSRAGGFLIDSRHVVTSLKGCCGAAQNGQTPVPLALSGKDSAPAKIVWSESKLDLAVLELDKPLGTAVATLVPESMVEKGQKVYSVQHPEPGKDGEPEVVAGEVQNTGTVDGTTARVYMTDVQVKPENSGAGLFDACGNAVGVNFLVKDNSLFSHVANTVISGLKSAGIQATVAEKPCGSTAAAARKSPAKTEWRLPQGNEWIPVVLIVAMLGLALRPATRTQVARALTRKSSPYTAPPLPYPQPQPVAPVVSRPVLRGISGQYMGTSLPLDAAAIILGRDPHAANLVFPSDSDSVSRKHCSVGWDPARQVFYLEDQGSSNGTFLSNGERLPQGQRRELRPGDRFYIGDMRNQFEVGWES